MRRGARRLRIWIGALGCGAWSWAQAVALPGSRVVPQGLDDYAKVAQIVDMRDNLNPLADDPKFSKTGDKNVLDRVGGDIAGALSANLWALRQKRAINGKRVDFLLQTAEHFQGVTQASLLEPGKPVVLAPTGDDALSLQEAAPRLGNRRCSASQRTRRRSRAMAPRAQRRGSCIAIAVNTQRVRGLCSIASWISKACCAKIQAE